MATTTVRGTPAWLRATNTMTAMKLLIEHGPLTRNRLAELSGLSKPTAAQMVAGLEEAGLIRVAGEVSGGRGPNAVSYAVCAERLVGVAIDITAEAITSTIVDATDSDHPVATLPFDGTEKRSAVMDVQRAIDASCDVAHVSSDAVGLVCIGLQAAVAQRADELSFTNTLPGWPTTGTRRHLEAELGVTVTIDNDANLAAMAERAAGSAEDVDGFALLWLGEGIGLAIDVAGQVYRGASGGAGEIGYLTVPHDAASLDPGAEDLTALFGASAWRDLQSTEGPGALRALAERVSLGLVPVLAVLDPERIVLGGPTGAEGGSALAAMVAARVASNTQWTPDVVASAVVHNPVLRGAREVLVAEVRDRLFHDVALITA